MQNQTVSRLVEQTSEKVLALVTLMTIGMAAIDPVSAAYYLSDGSGKVTGAVAAGTGTIGAGVVGGVAATGATAGAVLATGGAAIVVVGAAAA